VRGRLVHAQEDGVVVAAQPDLELGLPGVPGALDRLDQRGVVDRDDLVEAGDRCGDHTEPAARGHAELVGELHGQVDADRRHRVMGAEVVVGERRVEDDRARSRALHGFGRYRDGVLTTSRVLWWPA
jgi:hypothetical protein